MKYLIVIILSLFLVQDCLAGSAMVVRRGAACTETAQATGTAGTGYNVNESASTNAFIGAVLLTSGTLCQVDINLASITGAGSGDVSGKTFYLYLYATVGGEGTNLTGTPTTIATFSGSALSTGWNTYSGLNVAYASGQALVLTMAGGADAVNYVVWDVDTTTGEGTKPESDWYGVSRWDSSLVHQASNIVTDLTMRIYTK